MIFLNRNQFTFYASFYDAISRIKNKNARLAAYDALCALALTGEAPNLENMPNQAAIAISLIQPNLEASLRKAQCRLAKTKQEESKNKTKTNEEQNRNKREGECESKGEYESESKRECKRKVKNECLNTESLCADPFEIFWEAYPKKVDKDSANQAFWEVDVPVEQLVKALQEQQRSSQWKAEGGRYIPNPATWLKRKGWEDQLIPAGGNVPRGASGLGPEELENIQRLLREG